MAYKEFGATIAPANTSETGFPIAMLPHIAGSRVTADLETIQLWQLLGEGSTLALQKAAAIGQIWYLTTGSSPGHYVLKSWTDTNPTWERLDKDMATEDFVNTKISEIPSPMQFKGTIGTGGTVTTLPTATTSTGFTYKVITDATYSSIPAKVGDLLISNGAVWVLIPSGDDLVSVATDSTIGGIKSSGDLSVSTTGVPTVKSVNIVGSLPTTDNFVGRQVTYQGRSYIWNGSAWKCDADTLGGRNPSYYINNNDVIQNTNPFGGRKLYINSLDNALAAADKKYFVIITIHKKNVGGIDYPKPINAGNILLPQWEDSPIINDLSWQSSLLFDNNYEGGISIPADSYAKIRINWNQDGTSFFNGYPYGFFYLNYYYYNTPDLGNHIRLYNGYSPQGEGYRKYDFYNFIGDTYGYSCIQQVDEGYNYMLRELEFIVFGKLCPDGVNPTILTQIEWKLERPFFASNSPLFTNYGSNKAYYPFRLGTNLANNLTLNPDGTIVSVASITSNETINYDTSAEPTQTGTVTKTSTTLWQNLFAHINFLWLKLKELFPTTQATTHNYLPKIDNTLKKLVKSNIYDDGTNVGIGTTNPRAKLDIPGGFTSVLINDGNIALRKVDFPTGGGWARSLMAFQEYDGTLLYHIGALGNNNTFTNGYIGVAWNNTTMRWYPNNNVVFDGNVGIGTTAPNEKLDVNGSVKANGYKVGAGTDTKLLTDGGGTKPITDFAQLENDKIKATNLPDYLLGQVLYGGSINSSQVCTLSSLYKDKFNTTNNTRPLNNLTASLHVGVYFIASGSFTLNGTIDVEVGDWVISDGNTWGKIDNTDAVASVNGKTGVVNIGYEDLGDMPVATESEVGGIKLGFNPDLDADLLDGKHASDFATSTHNHDYSLLANLPAIYNAKHEEVQTDDFDELFSYENDVWLCSHSMCNAPLDNEGNNNASYNTAFDNCVIHQFGLKDTNTKVQVLYITTGDVTNISMGYIFYRMQGDKWKRIATHSDIADLQSQIDSLVSTVNSKQDKMSETTVTPSGTSYANRYTFTPTANRTLNINCPTTQNLYVHIYFFNSLEEAVIIVNNNGATGTIDITFDDSYKVAGMLPFFTVGSKWIISIFKGILFFNQIN